MPLTAHPEIIRAEFEPPLGTKQTKVIIMNHYKKGDVVLVRASKTSPNIHFLSDNSRATILNVKRAKFFTYYEVLGLSESGDEILQTISKGAIIGIAPTYKQIEPQYESEQNYEDRWLELETLERGWIEALIVDEQNYVNEQNYFDEQEYYESLE